MKLKNLILRSQHFFWIALFVFGFAFAQHKTHLSLDGLIIELMSDVLPVLMGACLYLVVLIIAKSADLPPEQYWQRFFRAEKLLIAFAVFNLIIGSIGHHYFLWTGTLAMLSGYTLFLEVMIRRRMKRLKELCVFYEKISGDEKKIVIENAECFIDSKQFFETVIETPVGMVRLAVRPNLEKLLSCKNLAEEVRKAMPEFKWYLVLIMQDIFDFVSERRFIIEEDKLIYNEGIDVDSTVVRRRNALEGKKESFKKKWKHVDSSLF